MSNTLSLQKKSPITFYVFRKDGSRNPDIKRAFLEKRTISIWDAQQGFIVQTDDTRWQLILENEVKNKLAENKEATCLVSFQLRIDGNFAVARLFRSETKEKNK